MSSNENEAPPAELNDLGKITFQLAKYGQQFSNNIQGAFEDMGPREWLRLVIIAGGYMLLRSQLMKWLGRRQLDEMEKQDAKDKAAQISPNELRGAKAPGDELDGDEDEDEGQATATDWGARARTRQRVMLKQLMEAEERRKLEEDDDKDIADLLED